MGWATIGIAADSHKQRNKWVFLGLAPVTTTLFRCKFHYTPTDRWEGDNFPTRVYAWQKIRFSVVLLAGGTIVSLPFRPRLFWDRFDVPLITRELPPELVGEVDPSVRIEVMFTSRVRRSDSNWFTTQFTLEADL
jgi:hypothetical protein